MVFIALLILVTTAIAFAAAYFSVYGLAYTFSGVFWSVVAMGASLEAGKLIAASYLYRYWTQTHFAMKAYLMSGIAALMLLTSVGIFGYLSSGYQQNILPLKQKHERITLLEEEKARVLTRKQEIDQLMTGGPAVNNVTRANGNIDPAAARTIREATRAREALVRQYKDEQKMVNTRLQELDAEMLTLKQDVIQAEAKIGPITYIASSFNLPTDDATKYLIFVIIFAFDPMAVALTLAVNNVLRIRREEKQAAEAAKTEHVDQTNVSNLPPYRAEEYDTDVAHQVSEPAVPPPTIPMKEEVVVEPEPIMEPEPAPAAPVEEEVVVEPEVEPVVEQDVDHVATPEPTVEPEPAPVQQQPEIRIRPYPRKWIDPSNEKIGELIQHHKHLTAKRDSGIPLSHDEIWELSNIEKLLRQHGVNLYL